MPKLMETRPGLIEANGHSYRLKKPLTKPVRAASNVIDFMPTTKPNKVEERFHPVTTKQTKPTKTPPKKKPNPFAALSKLAASVLTNRFKTRDQIANDVRGHGWKGSLALLGPVLNSLVNLGAAEEIDGRYRRA